MPRLPGNIEKCGLLLCCVLPALFTCIISYISLSLKANVKLLSERIIRLETTGIWMSGIKLTFTSVLNAQCRWGKRCRGSSPVSQHRFMSCWSDRQICNSERHVPSVKFFFPQPSLKKLPRHIFENSATFSPNMVFNPVQSGHILMERELISLNT